MLTLSIEERLALLLSVLGQDATKAALKNMNPTRAKFVSKLLDDYKTEPPNAEEVEFIIKDFNKYFSFAMETLGPEINKAKDAADEEKRRVERVKGRGGASKETGPKITYFDPVTPTGDHVADLNKLDAFQIATALADDHPKTIALILGKLSTTLAASIVKNLEDDVRSETIVFLSYPTTVPDRIVEQVLSTTFEKANAITMQKEEVDRSQVMAQLMRSLPKDMRNELIEKLSEENEDLVEEIRSKLYVFEDILRLDDRDTQKVIGETETDSLIVALQQADAEITSKLLNNLSKRARQTIEEEMQYKTGVSEAEIMDARSRLVDALGRLDEAGEITMS